MVWTTPRLWTTGELVTASMMNTYVSDDLAYLKGSVSTVTIDNNLTVSGTVNAPAVGATNATVTGTLTAGAVSLGGQNVIPNGGTFTAGPYTNDWFRVSSGGNGLFNSVQGFGISFNGAGPTIYPTGDNIVGLTTAQDLSNKRLIDPHLSGPTGFVITANDLTNYLYFYGAGTVTLPAAANRFGQMRFIKAWGGQVTVNSGSSNLIAPGQKPPGTGGSNPLSSFNIPDGASALMVCEGTNWWAVGDGRRIDTGGQVLLSLNTGSSTTAINYNAAFTLAPIVTATICNLSGGTGSLHLCGYSIGTPGTNGFFFNFDNQTGGTQTVTVNWIAVGS